MIFKYFILRRCYCNKYSVIRNEFQIPLFQIPIKTLNIFFTNYFIMITKTAEHLKFETFLLFIIN